MARYLITLSEFNRIHQVTNGVLRAIGSPERSCVFFACCGAMLLNKKFGIPARAVAGGFALCIDEAPKVAFFGKREQNGFVIADDGFHMWVQTESHVIDFMAPIFAEAFAEHSIEIPRKMFQRRLSTEAPDLEALTTPGDFYTLPDPDLTEAMINKVVGSASSRDLLEVADTWFGKRTRRQQPHIRMGDSMGEIHDLSLPATVAIGSW